MKKIFIYTLALPFALGLQAQTKVEGDATISAGYGDTAPFEELKRCADEMASADLTMQTIRDVLKEE